MRVLWITQGLNYECLFIYNIYEYVNALHVHYVAFWYYIYFYYVPTTTYLFYITALNTYMNNI